MTDNEAIEVITHFDKHIIPCDEYGYRIDSDLMEAHLMAAHALCSGWIPVSERLPSWNDGKVLVFTKYGFSICERTVNGRWKGQHANWITHWMPLPEAPKEESK